MPLLLHINTCFHGVTVAMSKEGSILAESHHPDSKESQSHIHTSIENILTKTDLSIEQLEAISICIGPGSYTGIRIGLATAKGLCWALHKPLIALSSLRMIAYATQQNIASTLPFHVLLHARANEYYTAYYEDPFSEEDIRVVTTDDIRNIPSTTPIGIAQGDRCLLEATERLPNLCVVDPQLSTMVSLSSTYALKGEYHDLVHTEPLYIRNNYTY